MTKIDLQIFADYNQFYLMDAVVQPMIPEEWTDEDVATMAKVEPHLVVVCPI